ncbi:hypothetical protein PV325_008753 [Microctonus aethiopoides]|uniref:Ubiquitin-like-conjugating enzyme ATG10 n=1 Tax=Microctonus aethiopoides TaxID=144406 RepID=A0AA39FQI8_9HYME|nr:hypothetical protein PV325_008753 [Microctonus aethiopoides]KAK0092955.1 hypothetical protein PV326_000239 [Microctonus aethiopoides]KAK0173524.1 hypothetical protein PV328_006707 [Microctonus aethiopoides]
MDGHGTITWDEFVENAKSLIRVSDEILDSWKFNGDKDIPGQAYLTRQIKTFVNNDLITGSVDGSYSMNNSNDMYKMSEVKDPFEASNDQEVPLIIEHHVLWSMSYSVPILLFNGYLSDFPGINPVSVELAQRLVHHGRLNYSELSQAIHPILGKTFLQLHPCMSKELIQNTSKSKNKLVSWLSAVAPAALNFQLKNEYFALTN